MAVETIEIAIPKHATQTTRGWVWQQDMDPGDPEVGPQPNVVRFILPLNVVSAERRVYGTTYVTVPLAWAHKRGLDGTDDDDDFDYEAEMRAEEDE